MKGVISIYNDDSTYEEESITFRTRYNDSRYNEIHVKPSFIFKHIKNRYIYQTRKF